MRGAHSPITSRGRSRGVGVIAVALTAAAGLTSCGTPQSVGTEQDAAPAVAASTSHVSCGNPPVRLEKQDQAFLNQLAAADGTPLYKLSYSAAREALNKLQAGPVQMPAAEISQRSVPGGPTGPVTVHVVRPEGVTGDLPGIVYIHGGGWILGNFKTHERLVRQIATGSRSTVVFVDYSPSPEAQFPVPVEQAYTVAKWLASNGRTIGVDASHVAVAGDSVGGDMTAAVTLLAKQRGGPQFKKQVMMYPVTDAHFDTASYQRFAENCWLTSEAMKWFWKTYAPNAKDRENPIAAPLRATIAQLRGLPSALVITDSDVLFDEGTSYADKLKKAGVPTTATHYPAITHDFMMLNALSDTESDKKAVAEVTDALYTALHDGKARGHRASGGK
ncbi:alpha/beta hydrolase fold domain-containing protein [Streptomyces broussonetiae]|uniref:Alpha/beta hydrolase fold domain-containing protein n=1 Tax=Streptomyces broussonetiae TaxID=2686304 RepID=A0A6I6MXV4_9ACTN|nr:alpha/beta hydrolase [Streptomyces broussonetiae]QHA02460.1 alpha/beta hydrolase fold domain-containing protein [Streptomyces broussonetiae]